MDSDPGSCTDCGARMGMPCAPECSIDGERILECGYSPCEICDDHGPSQVGVVICPHHADYARETGYGVERREAS